MATMAELFTQGYQMGQDIPRKDRAYRAARDQYGAAADDPALFTALQDQQNQNLQATQNMQIRGAQETRAQSTYDYNKNAAEEDKKRQAVIGLVNGLRQARDTGQDLGAAFDNLSSMLPAIGVDSGDIPGMRQALVDNPGVLDQYYAVLNGEGKMSATQSAAADKQAAAQTKADNSRVDVSRTISTMRDNYKYLDENKAIPTSAEGHTVGEGIGRKMASSSVGRLIGGAIGTKAETARKTIEGLRPQLLLAIKSAESLGAKMFDSNRDMEMWLSTVTDPSQPIQTVNALLDEFEQKYGAAQAGNAVEPVKVGDTAVSKPDTSKPVMKIYPGYVNPKTGATFKGGKWDDPNNWEMPK